MLLGSENVTYTSLIVDRNVYLTKESPGLEAWHSRDVRADGSISSHSHQAVAELLHCNSL